MQPQDVTLPQAEAISRLSSHGPAVRVEGVSKSFGSQRVLEDVSFELQRGKVYCIMGPSGCGKSTLLKIMIGAEEPDRGHVWLDGIDMWQGSREQLALARKKFGVLFQSGALLNGMTCGDNVALPLRQHTQLAESTIDMMVRMKLELVGMGHAVNLKPYELSGGMKKRAALARAIALDPAIVFYDEPSAGIDPVMIAVLDRLILDLTDKLGITSVVITHEMPSAFRIADEMLMLWNGRIHFRGTPEQVRACTDPVVRQFIHGDEEGPLSAARSKQAISARILGMTEAEVGNAAGDASDMAARSREAEERMMNRFKLSADAMNRLNEESRERRTQPLPHHAPDGKSEGEA